MPLGDIYSPLKIWCKGKKKKKTNTSTPIRSSYYTLYLYEQNMHVLVVVKQKEKWQLYEELRSSMQARETRRFQIGNENY